MKKPLDVIFQTVAIAWMLFVTYQYFFYHPEYFGAEKIPSAFLQARFVFQFLAITGSFYVGWVLYQATFKEKEKLSLSLTPFATLGIFTGFLFVFADFYFLREPVFREASFVTANLSLLSKLGTVYLTLFLLTFYSFVFGKKVLNQFNLNSKTENRLGDNILSIALGLGVIMLIIFVLGIFKQITAMNLLFIAVLSLGLVYKEVIFFGKQFFLEKFTFEARFFSFKILFLFALSLVLAMNAIDLIRPMPIGWDDMGVYLNYPKQLANNQALLAGSANNYFLIASLPFTFFKNEYLASMNGMFVSYWGGILMLFALMAFVKKFLKKEYVLMVASLIYIIPMTMHQSYADMKTDMILFFFMLMCVYAFFNWFVTKNLKQKKWLIVAGFLAGIAFGIKPTSILLIFGILIGIFYRIWGIRGAIGIFLLEWIPFYVSGNLHVLKSLPKQNVWMIFGLIALIALISFYFANKKEKKLSLLCVNVFTFILFTGISFSPWIIKNLNEHDYRVSVGTILSGKNKEMATLNYKDIGVDSSKCTGTAYEEELGRYLGYDEGIMRYVSLPWKVTMNTTVHGFYLDLSFLFLSFVPLGLLVFFLRKKHYQPQTQKIWQAILLMGGASWLMWAFVGSGVIWYGIFGFVLILPFTAYFFYENHTISLKIITGTLVVLSIFSVIAFRATKFGNGATVQYAYGIKSGLETVDSIVPNYRQIACIATEGKWNSTNKTCTVSDKKEFSPIYRIGTFISYFIPDNNRRIFNDSQLDTFKCIDDSFGNNDLITMRKYKELGYKYFIFDLNTATIEKDPKGSLHQKANRFVEWVNNLNQESKMYVHVYNKKKGIAFLEITDEKKIEN